MTPKNTVVPHPGEIIRDELEARGWSQRDLAYVLGVAEGAVTLMLSGKRGISVDMARALGNAFDVSPEFFVNLQSAYDLARAREPDPSIARKGKLQSAYPVREMIKRGWFSNDVPTDVLEHQLGRFFEWTTGADGCAHAAKKTSYESTTPAQLAWVARVRQLASEMVLDERYSDAKLRDGLGRLRGLMSAPEEARHVPRALAELGIRFVVVEVLQGSKMDGVCLWLNDQSPVIGMSLRFDRIDNFWFVLAHELGHVVNRHGRTAPMIDDELEGARAGDGEELPEEERVANRIAQDFCVPTQQLESFVARKAPYFSERDLVGFASRLGVHSGIVAGQIRRRTNNWRIFAKHLAKVRAIVTASAVVDGWGEIAPTGEIS